MSLHRWSLAIALAMAATTPAAAQTGGFIVKLGTDTLAVERFTRNGNRLEGEIVGKVPQVMVRSYVVEFGSDGRATRAEVTLRRPGQANPVQVSTSTFTRDSVRIETRRDTAVTRRTVALAGSAIAVPAGPGQSWAITEVLADRLRASQADSIHLPLHFVGSANAFWIAWIRVGRDSVRIRDSNGGQWRGRLSNGRLQAAAPVGGTQQFTAERIDAPNVTQVATAWQAREQQTSAAGTLSPRDTVRASVGGATLWVDYGRPSKRGRQVYGSPIVPFGAVWRTGANAATQFRTDKALEIGGVVLQPGFYTLWTIPSPSGWKLLINSETGQWGTAHKPERDLFQLDMTTSTLPQPVERFTISVVPSGQGGTLQLDWDTTRASIPFTVRN